MDKQITLSQKQIEEIVDSSNIDLTKEEKKINNWYVK